MEQIQRDSFVTLCPGSGGINGAKRIFIKILANLRNISYLCPVIANYRRFDDEDDKDSQV